MLTCNNTVLCLRSCLRREMLSASNSDVCLAVTSSSSSIMCYTQYCHVSVACTVYFSCVVTSSGMTSKITLSFGYSVFVPSNNDCCVLCTSAFLGVFPPLHFSHGSLSSGNCFCNISLCFLNSSLLVKLHTNACHVVYQQLS